jgi:hypothetical protein
MWKKLCKITGRNRTISIIVLLMFILTAVPSNGLRYSAGTNLKNVDASFIGEDHGDQAGDAVRSVGDLNGDGYDDFVIGANEDTDNAYLAGQIYVIFGKASGWSMDTDLSNANASYLGNADEQMGSNIAGIGDLNGDGYDDFAVGVDFNKEASYSAGQVYIIFGRPSGWAMDTDLDNANASIQGATDFMGLGYSVSGAGDVNGDGFDDLLVAAYNSSILSNQGVVYLLLGSDSGWKMDMDISVFSASFLGEAKDNNLRTSSGPVGDVNGDGYDDIMVMTPFNKDGGNGAGKAYILFGKASGWKMGVDVSGADASFIAETAGDSLGVSGMGVGDVNGDGLDDILLGASKNGEVGTSAGKAYLIFGKKTGWSKNVRLWNADASFRGQTKNDLAGKTVAGAGDVNGDNLNDLLIGAPGNKSSTGRVYLLLGKTSGWSINASLSTANLNFIGENNADHAGDYYGLSGGGDHNGDGLDDVLVGALGNTEGGDYAGQAYLIFPDLASKPNPITSVKLYSDKTSTNQITTAKMNDVIYVELVGTDTNASRADTAIVDVSGPSSSAPGLWLNLRETGLNTGTFRGNFTIKEITDDAKRWINAPESKQLIISSIQDKTKNATLNLDINIILKPNKDNPFAVEDQTYTQHYWAKYGTVSSWTVQTNATWLKWNSTTHNISGTPSNVDVGSYWVRINITDGLGHYDEHNFTLTVSNVPVKITSVNDLTAPEDSLYSVDYASDDDPSTTWSIKTNATWLAMASGTGVLSGTPNNSKVGSYWVNVTCDDGHGGKARSNFTVVVSNVPPTFGNSDVTTATEDVPYSVDYGTDDDPGVSFTLSTNSSFLSINTNTGLLSGTPVNSNVGSWYVNISARDNHGAKSFRNFSLGVTNVPPLLTTGNIVAAIEDVLYTNDYGSTDDPSTTWTISTDADFLSMNTISGILNGTPDNSDIGDHYVNVSVRDGHGGSDFSNFTLAVTNVRPLIETVDVLLVNEDSHYHVDYNSSDDLDGGPAISWSMASNASWLTINATTGLVSGTPDNSHVGWYWVNVSVADGNGGGAYSNFTLTVQNKPPKILSSDILSVKEDSEYFVHYNSDDDNPGTVTWSLETNANWLKLDPTEGIINGTPDNSMVGKYDVKVTADDGHGGIAFTTFVLIVINTPPVIMTAPITGVTQDQQYFMDFNSTDDGLGIIYWTMPKGPTWLTMDHDTGVLKGTPGNSDVGECQINVTVSDGNGGTGSIEYKLTVINVDDPAMWTRVPTDTVLNKGETYSFDVDAIEPDTGTTPVFGISSTPQSSITINAKTGGINWVPTEYGKYTITISFGDKSSNIYHNFIIRVNTPPKITLASPLNGTEVDLVNPTFQWSVIDDDGDNVTSNLYYGTDEAGVGALGSQYLKGIGLKDTYYVTVVFLEKGKNYYWTVIPDDGLIKGNCASGVWRFTVKANATENAPPRFTSTADLQAKVGVQWNYTPLAIDDDPGDQPTISLISGPEGLSLVSGVIHWIPSESQVGIFKVKLQATDGKSAIYQEFSITVSKISALNHPPVIDLVSSIKVKEGETISIKLTATDSDGDTVKFELISGPQGLSINEEGQLVWVTKKGNAGSYNIMVRASDGKAVDNKTITVKVEKVGGTTSNAGLVTILAVLLVLVMIIVVVVLIAVLRTRKERATSKEPAVEAAPPKSTTNAAAMRKAVLKESGQKVQTDKKIALKPIPVKEKGKAPEKKYPDVPAKGTPTVTQQKVAVIEAVDLDDLDNE